MRVTMQKTQRRRRRVLGGRDKLDADGRIANSSATRSRRLAPSEAESVSKKGNSYDHTNRAANARRRCGRREGRASSPALGRLTHKTCDVRF